MVFDVLGSESQSFIVQTPEPIVPPQILFPREKLVQVESAQFVVCMFRLQVIYKFNLLRMAPTADEALELLIGSLLYDV